MPQLLCHVLCTLYLVAFVPFCTYFALLIGNTMLPFLLKKYAVRTQNFSTVTLDGGYYLLFLFYQQAKLSILLKMFLIYGVCLSRVETEP